MDCFGRLRLRAGLAMTRGGMDVCVKGYTMTRGGRFSSLATAGDFFVCNRDLFCYSGDS